LLVFYKQLKLFKMSKFRVINRTTRQEHIFNSEEIKRFFNKNLMSDYAISSIKYEEQKTYSLLADIIVGIASVILIVWITNLVVS